MLFMIHRLKAKASFVETFVGRSINIKTTMEGDWSGRMRKEETKRSSSDDSMFNVQCIWTIFNQQFYIL